MSRAKQPPPDVCTFALALVFGLAFLCVAVVAVVALVSWLIVWPAQ